MPPLYPDAARELWTGRYPALRMVPVDDVNHYTVVMLHEGAAQVRAHVVEALGSAGDR